MLLYKAEKPYLVYLANEQKPLNLLAHDYAEVVHKAIEFIRNNGLVTTIKKNRRNRVRLGDN